MNISLILILAMHIWILDSDGNLWYEYDDMFYLMLVWKAHIVVLYDIICYVLILLTERRLIPPQF